MTQFLFIDHFLYALHIFLLFLTDALGVNAAYSLNLTWEKKQGSEFFFFFFPRAHNQLENWNLILGMFVFATTGCIGKDIKCVSEDRENNKGIFFTVNGDSSSRNKKVNYVALWKSMFLIRGIYMVCVPFAQSRIKQCKRLIVALLFPGCMPAVY